MIININKVSPPEMDECLLRVLRMFVHHQLVQRFYRKPNFQLDTTIYKSSLLIESARALLTRRKCKYASRNVLYSISMSKMKNSKKYNRPNIETLQPPSASDTGHRGKPRYQQLDNNRHGLPSIQTQTCPQSVTLSSCTRLLVWKNKFRVDWKY